MPKPSPLDGRVPGVDRLPVSERALAQVQALQRDLGWTPRAVGDWTTYWLCPAEDCRHAWPREERWIGAPGLAVKQFPARSCCPLCEAEACAYGHGRPIHFSVWWNPLTWGRPPVIDFRDAPRAAYEVLRPAAAPMGGEVSLALPTDTESPTQPGETNHGPA